MFVTSSTYHVVASSVLFDSRLTMWTRFRGALNLFYAFGCVGIMVAKLVKLVACEPLVPYTLVFVANLGKTVTTVDCFAAPWIVELTTATAPSRAPYPV